MIFEIGNYILDIDIEKTRSFYDQATKITDACDCQGCRNYTQWATTYDADPKYILESMGVLLEKSAEVYVNCLNEDGTLFYGGFYHICGKIVLGPKTWVAIDDHIRTFNEDAFVSLKENFQVAFTEDIALLEKNFPTPVIQMEISANIPFVLSEKCEY